MNVAEYTGLKGGEIICAQQAGLYDVGLARVSDEPCIQGWVDELQKGEELGIGFNRTGGLHVTKRCRYLVV